MLEKDTKLILVVNKIACTYLVDESQDKEFGRLQSYFCVTRLASIHVVAVIAKHS